MASFDRRLPLPWLDRQGRLSPLKLGTLLLLPLPALWLGWQAAHGQLGARPITEAIHGTGLWAVRILLLSLLVTPLRQMLRWPRLLLVRRMVGLGALAYAALHLLLYALDQGWNMPKVASEIVLRFYLTIGFVALLGLAALGVTSTDGWVRRLGGPRWQRLHRAAYGIAALAILHFAIQSKIDVTEAVLMAGLFMWLMGYRLVAPKGSAPSPGWLLALAAGAMAGTALLEAGWYAATTGVPPGAVLAENLDIGFGLRPALWVGLSGLAMLVARSARLGLERWAPPRAAH